MPRRDIEPQPKLPTRREFLAGLLGMALGGVVTGLTIDRLKTDQFEATTELKESSEATIKWLPSTVIHYKDLIEANAEKYEVDANLIAILMTVESGGYSRAGEGPEGEEDKAKGLMQITPTAEGDIRSMHLQESLAEGTYDIYDAATNIEFGAAFINWLRNQIVARYPNIPDDRLAVGIATSFNGGLEGSGYPFLGGEGIEADEAAFYGRIVWTMWLERKAAVGRTYERWRELDLEGLNLVGRAEAEQVEK